MAGASMSSLAWRHTEVEASFASHLPSTNNPQDLLNVLCTEYPTHCFWLRNWPCRKESETMGRHSKDSPSLTCLISPEAATLKEWQNSLLKPQLVPQQPCEVKVLSYSCTTCSEPAWLLVCDTVSFSLGHVGPACRERELGRHFALLHLLMHPQQHRGYSQNLLTIVSWPDETSFQQHRCEWRWLGLTSSSLLILWLPATAPAAFFVTTQVTKSWGLAVSL